MNFRDQGQGWFLAGGELHPHHIAALQAYSLGCAIGVNRGGHGNIDFTKVRQR